MLLEVITPNQTLYQGNAKSVQLPGTDGSFQLLENHAPIISSLKKGAIKIVDKDNNEATIQINSGVIEMLHNKVIVLAEPAI